jgi:hypothetical protein
MQTHQIFQIVSGGQTGVDRAALDVAIFLGMEHGGWCPRGRRAESGPIPDVYQLRETESRDYSVRTERNVIDSDGTLILYRSKLSGGTELTYKLALKHKRPHLCVDLDETLKSERKWIGTVVKWVADQNIGKLNIAGPRESSSPGISELAEQFLIKTFSVDPG